MKQLTLGLLCLALLAIAPASALAASDDDGFAAFKILLERNIFNPDRNKPKPPKPPVPEVKKPDPPPPRKPDFFRLTGAMNSEKGAIAFFEGSSSKYSGALGPGAGIAGYTLDRILADQIELKKDETRVALRVGSGMMSREEGVWQINNAMPSSSSSNSGPDRREQERRDQERRGSDSRGGGDSRGGSDSRGGGDSRGGNDSRGGSDSRGKSEDQKKDVNQAVNETHKEFDSEPIQSTGSRSSSKMTMAEKLEQLKQRRLEQMGE